MNAVLKLNKIVKRVGSGEGQSEILHGVSLTLEAGEFVAVMGPSGCGKSTLLHMAGLLDTPTAGEIELLGQDVTVLRDDQLAALRSRRLGFIFQSFNLLAYLTVRQNVALPLAYQRDRHPRVDVDELLAQVRLTHRSDAYPVTLSGGERQRVAIARALANGPALLLADEPTGSLDSVSGQQIMELLSALHHRGATILLVTHDEAIARRAERVLTMRDGRFE